MATVRTGNYDYDGDPLIGFMFRVTFGSGPGPTTVGRPGATVPLATAYFTELSGLTDESEVVTHKSVDENGREVIQKIPGRYEAGEITLKRGVTRGQDFWNWRQMVMDGDTEGARRNIQITLFDRAYSEVISFEYRNAWPSAITVTGLESSSSSYVVEEITLQHEGFLYDSELQAAQEDSDEST